jgi:2-methylcitrate dehydratase PrpD
LDAAASLAGFVARTRFEDLPGAVVASVKRTVLDALGVAAAGSAGPGIREILDLYATWGGRPESRVMVFGNRFPAVHAAFVNGAMARALDYNETYDSGSSHPSISVIPAAAAATGLAPNVSGKDFITAIALGFEVQCRMADAVAHPGHWIAPQLTGYISAAAAAGKLLGLTEEQILNAFGIAYSQCAGGRQSSTERAHTRGLQGAFSARDGVLSALLARCGTTGPQNCIEGEHGYFQAYYNGQYERSALVDQLGEEFRFPSLSYKPYPSCRHLHCHILATLEVVTENDLRPENVAEVTAYVGDFVMGTFRPEAIAYMPRTIVDRQFSGPYVMAAAIVNRSVSLADFLIGDTPSAPVLDMARRITPQYDSSLSPPKKMEFGRVQIKTRGGQVFMSRTVEVAKGHPLNPMTDTELVAKFRDCLGHAARSIPRENIDRAIDVVADLESVPQVGAIFDLLVGK